MNSKRNIKPFDGEKYSVWKLRLRNLFNELNVLDVIDGITLNKLNAEWQNKERLAKNTIIEYLSDSLLGLTSQDSSVRDIILKLDSI